MGNDFLSNGTELQLLWIFGMMMKFLTTFMLDICP